MGLSFAVGNPADVFIEPFAETVRQKLHLHFPKIVLDSPDAPAYSEELGWSGWTQLQERASFILSGVHIYHFLSMEAWQGVYVPCNTDIDAFEFEGHPTPLNVASLNCLLQELESIGLALELPTDDAGIRALARSYRDDDDRVDDDMDIQTYCQLVLMGREAKRRNQPLWIVK